MNGRTSELIGSLYEHFVLRDVVYAAGGALVLGSAKYAWDGDVWSGADYVSKSVPLFLLFLVAAYFVGLLVQEGLTFLKVVKTAAALPVDYEEEEIVRWKISKVYGRRTLAGIERTIFLKQVGSTIGASAFISYYILLANAFLDKRVLDVPVVIAMAVVTLVCIGENRCKLRQQSESYRRLLGNIAEGVAGGATHTTGS